MKRLKNTVLNDARAIASLFRQLCNVARDEPRLIEAPSWPPFRFAQ
jgi:hypothetical protein